MRALLKRGEGSNFELQERPDPHPGPEDVIVRVHAVGVCGTDEHILHDVYPHADPLIPGHEFVGEIVSLGEQVQGWREGERVVSELHTGACLQCARCRSGNPQICPHKRALGTWTDGAYAELVRVPAWLLHHAPPGVDNPHATLIEPAACALHGILERGTLNPDESVLIVGHGPIGLLSAQVAAANGASFVAVSGTSRRGTLRLEAARSMGFAVIDSTTDDFDDCVTDLTSGDGFDLAIETAGTDLALAQCIAAVHSGGRVTVLGLSGQPEVRFPWDTALVKDLDLTFSFSSKASSWEQVIGLATDHRIGEESMITHVLDLEDWREGYDAIEHGQAVKVVLRP